MKPLDQTPIYNFIRLLMTAAANAALYDINHNQVLRFNKQALVILQQLTSATDALILRLINHQLIYNNKPLEETMTVKKLITSFSQRGISYLKIEGGIYTEELLNLIQVLSHGDDRSGTVYDSNHIHFGQVEVRYQSSDDDDFVLLSPGEIAAVEATHINDLYENIQQQKEVKIDGITDIVNGFAHSFNKQGDAFMALAPLRAIDEYTYTHSTNICLLNLAQAKALGIEGQLLTDIGIAAMLHDVGKMFISPSILTKTEALSDSEWSAMKEHPRLGAEYLLTVPGVPRLAVITAYEHHMRYDLAGYPEVGPGWKQHFCSYLTAISDTYDAMRTNRSYEDALDQNQIVNIMHNLAGNKLHPQLTYNFLTILQQLDAQKVH